MKKKTKLIIVGYERPFLSKYRVLQITSLPSANCQRINDNDKKDCELLAICNQTKYNEEKRGGDIYGKNSKCICTC